MTIEQDFETLAGKIDYWMPLVNGDRQHPRADAFAALSRIRAENERLLAATMHDGKAARYWSDRDAQLRAEVERLRETLRETEAADLAIGQRWIQRAQAAEAALDDIERLDIARIRAAWEQAQYPDAEGCPRSVGERA